MRIEAEIKALVRDSVRVQELLRGRAPEEVSVYSDTYFDTPNRDLDRDGRELRVRVVRTGNTTSTVFTYKDAAVEDRGGSKPEIETTAQDPDALQAILNGLGFDVVISFDKHCANYEFTVNGRSLLATLVRVPELAETYVEVESIVDAETEVAPALATIRSLLTELGIEPEDETTETYTDAVAARRQR